MTSYYKQLVENMGEDEAKRHMSEIRAKVKNPGYFNTLSEKKRKAFAKQGGKARWHKDEKTDTTPISEES